MNYIDIALGLLLLFAAIGGYRKGLISELAALAALILGIWGAIKFSHITSEFLVENFDWQWEHLNIVSFFITFVAIVILVHIVGSTVNKLAETVLLGFVNKLAGLVFGILKSALILSIILLIFDRIDEDIAVLPKDLKENSRMYEPIKNLAPTLFPFIDIWEEKENKDDPWYKKMV